MDGRKILVIDDDPDLVSLLNRALSRAGAQVSTARDGRDGLREFYAQRPDLVILDVVMPVMDGWQALSRIRELSGVPVILLTVQASEEETIRGLDAGAADYVAKPFSIKVLLARAEAALRMADAPAPGARPVSYDDGYLHFDRAARRALVRGEPLPLTDTEYRLLACLVENAGQVLSQRQILERVWGPEYCGEVQYVRAYISRLRAKLEADPRKPRYLLTARGAGYYFQGQAQVRRTE